MSPQSSSSPSSVLSASPTLARASNDGEAKAEASCWECQRRGWVCDSSRPICYKCRSAGIVCPGYGDTKPLVWLAPGKVTSRNRKKRSKNKSSQNASAPSSASEVLIKTEDQDGQALSILDKQKGKSIVLSETDEAIKSVVLGNPEDNQISTVLNSRTANVNVAWREITAIAEYYNAELYPEIAQLPYGNSPYALPFDTNKKRGSSLHHSTIAIVLQYRLAQLGEIHGLNTGAKPIGSSNEQASGLHMQLYHHTGEALRYLMKDVASPQLRYENATLKSIVMIVLFAVNGSITPQWKPHMAGLMSIVMKRGGLDRVMESAVDSDVKNLFQVLLIFTVLGNTTSPAEKQLVTADHFRVAHSVSKIYSYGPYPQFVCPANLFREIICINYLRYQIATDSAVSLAERSKPTRTAAIVARILEFSPLSYITAAKMPQRADIMAMVRLFRLAVLFFALNSLPMPMEDSDFYSEFPIAPAKMIELRTEMFELIRMWKRAPAVVNTSFWLWISIGVEAAKGSEQEQGLVTEELEFMSNPTSGPVMIALERLREFWKSGETDWNKCWDDLHYLVV